VQAEKGDVKVDKATPVGAVEVLFIETESQQTRRESTARLKSRSL
jgi:hypothetical protein